MRKTIPRALTRLLFVGGWLCVSNVASAEAPFAFERTPGKLPKDVVPESYSAQIIPDIEQHRFSGTESIEISVRRSTSRIVMNALNLEIEQASLSGGKHQGLTLAPVLDAEQQTLSFTLAKPLAPGRYRIDLRYKGEINKQAEGLYYDKYPTANGDRVLLGTQMEPTDARRLLPCWDEPSFRASFKLAVDLPAHFKAYSNTPAEQISVLPNGLQHVQFKPTPKMASYLVVLVAGELDRIQASQDGTEIGVVAPIGKQESSGYALKISQDLLHYYNDYFGIEFPLPKLDQIATPGGFQGAMENWGGIVYNETTLLYDPKKSSDSTKQRVFLVVAHEMAHQWFGDLVTTAWWDNLWLNEGFASWMETKATDHFNPDWDFWLRANDDRETAMALDARKTTHPIQQPVRSESEANDAFDQITYLKGQSFLRMLETYLGADDFRRGIQAYMRKHQYSNTTTADLWASLATASGKPVAKIANDWTTKPGFPVVNVDAVCEGGQRRITLTQEQFSLDGAPDKSRIWNIPIEIGVVGDSGKIDTQYLLLTKKQATIQRPGCDGALVLDPNAVGYYRVQYSPRLFDAISSHFGHYSASVRLKTLSDAAALVAANRLDAGAYLGLLPKIADEPKVAVWDTALNTIASFDNLLRGDALRPAFQRYAVQLLSPKFSQLGWAERQGEPLQDRELRRKLISALGDYGDTAVIAEAQRRFQTFLKQPESLTGDLADAVIVIAGEHADESTYDALSSLAQKALTTEEKVRYYRGLTAARDPKLGERSLALALSEQVPPLIGPRILALVANGGEHERLAWDYARAHGDELIKKVAMFARNRYFPNIVGSANDVIFADELEAYVKTHLEPAAMTEALRTSDAIRLRAGRKQRLISQLTPLLK